MQGWYEDDELQEELVDEDLQRVIEDNDRFLRGFEERIRPRRQIAFWNGDEYMADEEPDRTFLVEGFLPLGYLAVLGGNSKLGKSAFATALAVAVAKGEPFLGMPTLRSPILWCAYEETRRERMEVMRHYGDVPKGFHITHDCPEIDDPEDIEQLRWWLKETGAKLLVIDPLFGATTGSLTDGRTARSALMRLKCLCHEEDCAVLLIHHVNKDTAAGHTRERFAESNQILATASMDLLMDSRRDPDGARQIRLQGRGRGDFANRTWLIRSTGVSHFELIADGESDLSKTRLKTDAILEFLRASETPLTSEALAAGTNRPLPHTRNLMTELLREGFVVAVGKEGKKTLYAPEARTSPSAPR